MFFDRIGKMFLADYSQAFIFDPAFFGFKCFGSLFFQKPFFEFSDLLFRHQFAGVKIDADAKAFRNRFDKLMTGYPQIINPENPVGSTPLPVFDAIKDNPFVFAGWTINPHDNLTAFQVMFNARLHLSGFPVHLHNLHDIFLLVQRPERSRTSLSNALFEIVWTLVCSPNHGLSLARVQMTVLPFL